MELKELLGEELFAQVEAKVGDKKLAVVNDGAWFPKSKFDEVNTAKKELESTLKERDTQLAELKKSAGDNEELHKQIQDLQEANKQAAKDYEDKLTNTKIDSALKLALSGKVHDEDLAISQLDRSKIKVDKDGNVTGYEELVTGLQEAKPFLFVQKQETNTPQFKGMTPPDGAQQQQAKKYTRQQIESMSPQEITADWANISAQMSSGQIQ